MSVYRHLSATRLAGTEDVIEVGPNQSAATLATLVTFPDPIRIE